MRHDVHELSSVLLLGLVYFDVLPEDFILCCYVLHREGDVVNVLFGVSSLLLDLLYGVGLARELKLELISHCLR